MIIIKQVELNNQIFKHTYSDENFMIQKIGTDEIYSDAMMRGDVIGAF